MENNMNWGSIKRELWLIVKGVFEELSPKWFLATGLETSLYHTRFYGWAKRIGKQLRGWGKRLLHIFTEREKMTRELWLQVANMYNWTCLKCGLQNLYNKENGKLKMQVDHIKPLYLFGLTILWNLQLLCSRCNQQKGIAYVDYRANWINGRFIKNV